MVTSKVGMSKSKLLVPRTNHPVLIGPKKSPTTPNSTTTSATSQLSNKLSRNSSRTQRLSPTVSTVRPIFSSRLRSHIFVRAALFTSGAGFATHFSAIFHPISGEYDLLGKHPEAGHTIRSVDKYQNAMEELRAAVGPELELIESRVVGPTKEFQTVMKTIRKTITKRDHKACHFIPVLSPYAKALYIAR